MKLDVPFVPEAEHVALIKEYEYDIHSVYFTPSAHIASNARILGEEYNVQQLSANLAGIKARKYATLNGRFTPLEMYAGERLDKLVEWISVLADSDCLNGILYLDFYMLKALAPHLPNNVEAVPSINNSIDTAEKFFTHVKYLDDLGLPHPSKVILDRSLNRRIDDLHRTVSDIRAHSDSKIVLLANEGCLYQCPFKVNHDVVIGMFNDHTRSGAVSMRKASSADFDIRKLNEDLGCIDHLDNNFDEFFKIPFIRPEDLKEYEGIVDVVKFSGKVKGTQFNRKVIEAYLRGSFDGNLLDILDAPGSQSERRYVHNDMLNNGFHKKLTTCDKRCTHCDYCRVLNRRVVQNFG
jgi:collagenase-like PrtC family protease